jgi:hypothetical protein
MASRALSGSALTLGGDFILPGYQLYVTVTMKGKVGMG